jgi:hypothetical protein
MRVEDCRQIEDRSSKVWNIWWRLEVFAAVAVMHACMIEMAAV